MKKLIAILAVFALLTTAVFAQADIGAGGTARAELLKGDSNSDDLGTGFESWFWVSAKKTNEDNTMGAKGSFSIGMSDGNFSFDPNGGTYFYAWWQPIQQVFLKVGKVGEDGKYWAGAGILGWDFQSDDLLISPAFNYYNGFAGSVLGDSHGFWSAGFNDKRDLQLSILPIDGLAINFGFVFGDLVKSVYGDKLAAQIVYDIPDLGQAAIGFKNGGENEDKHLYAQYKMPIANMKIELGLHFPIAPKDGFKSPFDIGLGFGYGNPWGDTFWLNARIGVAIPMEDGDSTRFGVDINPSYDLGIFRVYVPVGVALILPDGGDALLAWSFNPYIRKQLGGLEFWAGVKLYNGRKSGAFNDGSGNWYPEVYNKDSQDQVNFSIPIALQWAW